MIFLTDVFPHLITLFDNPYLFSLLGLLALALVLYAFKILIKF